VSKLTTSLEFMMANLNVSSQEELFDAICRMAEETGFVLPGFCRELTAREKEFPTGLQTPIPIAIPHVGTSCVKSFFSLATLKQPILFNNMADPEESLPVRIVFLFGIVDPSEQVNILRKLSEIFQKKETLEAISKAKSNIELMEIMNHELKGYIA